MGSGVIEIRPVDLHDRRAMGTFIRFPWSIYPRHSPWCPPLIAERREFFDPKRNPFFRDASAQLFLALRGGQVVGRISVCEDRRANEFHGERAANFGFFESIDDERVAGALLDAASAWAAERGLETMRGPASFTSNHECGLLVSGFDSPPSIGMPYNPRYYQRLLEGQRLEKAKDIFMWWLSLDKKLTGSLSRLDAVAERIEQRAHVRLRTFDMKRWDEELAIALEIYNEAWKDNWGFVPLSPDEFGFLAKQMKHILRPELAFVAEADGRPVAFSLTVLDANQAVRRANGRLFPFGLVKLLYGMRRIDHLRLILLGVREGYRKRGIESLFYLHSHRAGLNAGTFKGGEIGWTLEDNDLINRAIGMMGGERVKTYRIYERAL